MGGIGWSMNPNSESLLRMSATEFEASLPPTLEVQTLDVHGVRFVRLTHLIDWLEDVDGALTLAEVRETLERVGEREDA